MMPQSSEEAEGRRCHRERTRFPGKVLLAAERSN